MELVKVKRPGEVQHRYQASALNVDESGHWLLLPRGGAWNCPWDRGTFDFPVVVLIPECAHWVAWWVPDAAGPELRVDICLPAQRVGRDWQFVDLELDLAMSRGSNDVATLDQDEFDEARAAGVISDADARAAETTLGRLRHGLSRDAYDWVERGWAHLDRASATTV